MAKTSMMNREQRRVKLSLKYQEKRKELKETMRKTQDLNTIFKMQTAFQKLPKDSNRIRIIRRCSQCGRSHAVYRRFALCRICLRNFLMLGDVPGARKSSW